MTPTCVSPYDINGVMCKVFPTNLKRMTLTWFIRLKLETINSFDDQAYLSSFDLPLFKKLKWMWTTCFPSPKEKTSLYYTTSRVS